MNHTEKGKAALFFIEGLLNKQRLFNLTKGAIMFKYLFTTIALIASTQCFAADTTTTIGSVIHTEGSVGFVISQKGDNKEALITAVGEHGINEMAFAVAQADLKDLHDILEATITALAAPATNIARETSTDVGQISGRGGSVVLTINQKETNREALLLIMDEQSIRKVHLTMSRQDLEKLRGLVDETVTELDKQ
jgi:4-hydroxyphenylpyruvate dioxygenase-like putative hemolysin